MHLGESSCRLLAKVHPAKVEDAGTLISRARIIPTCKVRAVRDVRSSDLRSKGRVLFIGHTTPYPPTRGGFIRSYNILRLLAREFDVDILCFDRVGKSKFASELDRKNAIDHLAEFGRVRIVRVPHTKNRLRPLWDHLRSLLWGKVFTYYRHDTRAFRKSLAAALATDYDIVHLDSLDLVSCLPRLANETVVCTHHNVESELLTDRSKVERWWPVKVYIRHQARLQRRVEEYWCPRVALNVTVSERDAQALERIAGGGCYQVIPNGVDVERVRPGNGSGIDVLGLGGLEWFPNRDAAIYFGEEVLPGLRKSLDRTIVVTWVGSVPEEDRELLEGEYGIQCPGFVDDVRPYILNATCYVMPYRLGGGTRLKLLEALASGSAIVTTSVGALGVELHHDQNALIADSPDQFVEEIVRVLGDGDLRSRLAIRARQTAVELYGWDAIGSTLTSAYSELVKMAES